MEFFRELRRRRVFRVMGVYVVGAWLVFQIAATFFPAWEIPDTALRYLVYGAVAGFPVAAIFGWYYDLTSRGIVRTPPADASTAVEYGLKPTDFVILASLAAVAIAVLYGSFVKVQETADGRSLATAKPENSIAVLPFENLDPNRDTAYFSDGVTDEILHRLSQFKSLAVLGRASSFAFRSSNYSIPRISDVLRVRYVLHGSVRRDARRVRVTARLLDERGFQVWSDSFDRELESVFAIQSDIANEVARQLNDELAPKAVPAGSVTTNPEAYNQYLIGRDHSNSRGAGYQDKAAQAYERAVALDPDFAAPRAGLAIMKLLTSGRQPEQLDETLRQAQTLIDEALAIDPDLADAHAAQGLLLELGQRADFAAAERALRRAIDLDPSFMNAYNWLVIALGSQGKHQEAADVQRHALEIDPLNVINGANAANAFIAAGDFHAARAQLLRLMDLPTPPGTVIISLQGLHQGFGKFVEANEWAKRRVRAYLPTGDTWCLAVLSNHYRYLGMTALADYWFEKSIADDPAGLSTFARTAYVYKLNGDVVGTEALLARLEQDGAPDPGKIPVFFAEVLGATKIMVGDYQSGIAIIEAAVDIDKPISTTGGGGSDALDFLHAVAYGYRQLGNEDRASEILEKAAAHMQKSIDSGTGRYPKFLEVLALNQAMRGETDAAVRTFERAVDTGWRNYLFVANDFRWREFLHLPAMKSALAFVKADLDRQRRLVEDIESQEDFKAEVEALLAATRQ